MGGKSLARECERKTEVNNRNEIWVWKKVDGHNWRRRILLPSVCALSNVCALPRRLLHMIDFCICIIFLLGLVVVVFFHLRSYIASLPIIIGHHNSILLLLLLPMSMVRKILLWNYSILSLQPTKQKIKKQTIQKNLISILCDPYVPCNFHKQNACILGVCFQFSSFLFFSLFLSLFPFFLNFYHFFSLRRTTSFILLPYYTIWW